MSTSRRLRARVAAEGATAAALALVHGSLLLLGESLRGGARLGPLLLARRGLLALLDVLGVLEVSAAAGLERERQRKEDERSAAGRQIGLASGKTGFASVARHLYFRTTPVQVFRVKAVFRRADPRGDARSPGVERGARTLLAVAPHPTRVISKPVSPCRPCVRTDVPR